MASNVQNSLVFQFVVSNVTLKADQAELISRSIAQAGALALAEVTPVEAVTVRVRPGVWWRGIPAESVTEALEKTAATAVDQALSQTRGNLGE